jgi:Fe2+ transport system protein FeoA
MKAGFMFIDDRRREEPLAALPVGSRGRIASVDASAVDLERLEVMGLCEGRLVPVVKQGSPMIVRVLGTRIGLAAALATGSSAESVASSSFCPRSASCSSSSRSSRTRDTSPGPRS